MYTQNRNRFIDIENKLVFTSGEEQYRDRGLRGISYYVQIRFKDILYSTGNIANNSQ